MYHSFAEIEKKAHKLKPKPVSVLYPDDPDVMRSIADGFTRELIQPILVGNQSRIEETAEAVGFSRNKFKIIDERDPQKAADLCVDMAANGEVSFVVKGNIITSYLYRSLIRNAKVLKQKQTTCTLCFHQAKNIGKIFIITDPGVNIYPDLECKRYILENAINTLTRIGYKRPKVMVLSAVSPAISTTASANEAEELQRLIDENEMLNCEFCNSGNLCAAYFENSFKTEDFPDIFLAPNIDTGNILVKTMDHLGGGIRQCVTVGGGIIMLTPSRSDGYANRMATLSLGVVLSSSQEGTR